MNRKERLGLCILHDEIRRAAFHTQNVINYTAICANSFHEEQLDCHLSALNDSFEQMELVIFSEWERNKRKIRADQRS